MLGISLLVDTMRSCNLTRRVSLRTAVRRYLPKHCSSGAAVLLEHATLRCLGYVLLS